MAADTSSSAAASTPVVRVAAAVCAALSIEPILDKSSAAEVSISGAAITNDIPTSNHYRADGSPFFTSLGVGHR